MKRLTLVRHANSEWKESVLADFDRPLNRRGISEAEFVARRLKEQELTPDIVMTSPARRTQQTADIIAREHGFGSRRIKRDEHIYQASAEDLLRIIRSTASKVEHLAVVGHNPGISELVKLLVGDSAAELGTGMACTMAFDIRMWSNIGPGLATDVRYERPPAQ